MMDDASWNDVYGELPVVASITSDSTFIAEAAESVEKCAAHCSLIDACAAYAFQVFPGAIYGQLCELFSVAPSPAVERGSQDGPLVWTAGLPPRSRALLRDARVFADELAEARAVPRTVLPGDPDLLRAARHDCLSSPALEPRGARGEECQCGPCPFVTSAPRNPVLGYGLQHKLRECNDIAVPRAD